MKLLPVISALAAGLAAAAAGLLKRWPSRCYLDTALHPTRQEFHMNRQTLQQPDRVAVSHWLRS